MEFRGFTEIRPVVTWQWNIKNKYCAICRNNLMEPSINCQASNSDIQLCRPVLGMCGHAYHRDCIEYWTKSHKVCPLCNADWKIKKFK